MPRPYSNIILVDLPAEAVKRAGDFASNVIATVNYADSNQTQKLKIKEDHFVSKLGEEAARIVLSHYGNVKGPDYSIYQAKEKSWESDLFIENKGIAVKTQKRTNANRYTLSWTFQAGAFRYDPILNISNAWIIFVEYDDTNPHHCYVYPPYQMKELTLGEPKLSYLKGSKKVVYASTLPSG